MQQECEYRCGRDRRGRWGLAAEVIFVPSALNVVIFLYVLVCILPFHAKQQSFKSPNPIPQLLYIVAPSFSYPLSGPLSTAAARKLLSLVILIAFFLLFLLISIFFALCTIPFRVGIMMMTTSFGKSIFMRTFVLYIPEN